MAGMILNAINYRLDAKTIAYIIDHSDIKLLFVDTEFLSLGEEALSLSKKKPVTYTHLTLPTNREV